MRSLLFPIYGSYVPAVNTGQFLVPRVPEVKALPASGALPPKTPKPTAFTADGIMGLTINKGIHRRTAELKKEKEKADKAAA